MHYINVSILDILTIKNNMNKYTEEIKFFIFVVKK